MTKRKEIRYLTLPDKDEIESLKKKWKNKRIILTEMVDEMVDDTLSVPSGTRGKCYDIDCLGPLQMNWDTGSTLNLLPDIDKFRLEDDIELIIEDNLLKVLVNTINNKEKENKEE